MHIACLITTLDLLLLDLSPYSTGNWLPNRNEIDTKILNIHAQREKFAFGIQRNLYYTDLRWGFELGKTQTLGLASGETQIFAFLDTNMLVYPMQN